MNDQSSRSLFRNIPQTPSRHAARSNASLTVPNVLNEKQVQTDVGSRPTTPSTPSRPTSKVLNGSDSPNGATRLNSARKANKASSLGWTAVAGVDGLEIEVVGPPKQTREKIPFMKTSWLHRWTHACALHAGLDDAGFDWSIYSKPSIYDDEQTSPSLLKKAVTYLSQSPGVTAAFDPPSESLWRVIPTKSENCAEIEAAFKLGIIHFSGQLSKDDVRGQPAIRLCAASVGMGNRLYRQFGSDRFFRLRLDDDLVHSGGRGDSLSTKIQEFLCAPLLIFGRRFRPFCLKDGAIIYWCESGKGIPSINLVEFSQMYIDVSINPTMSVAKFVARFELGLTPTTPTVKFRRNQIFRTPDLLSDSLPISYSTMRQICDQLRRDNPTSDRLPVDYIPSAIRGFCYSAKAKSTKIEIVWRLDFSTIPTKSARDEGKEDSDTRICLWQDDYKQLTHGLSSMPIVFAIADLDGQQISSEMKFSFSSIDWTRGAPQMRKVVMTDGCSLISEGAISVASKMLQTAMGEPESQVLPPAAQARLGPGKGLWANEMGKLWRSGQIFIEVRDSQWKFQDAQTESFTFELHSIPKLTSSGSFGPQLLQVLSHCGVPNEIFGNLFRQQLKETSDAFFDWSDPIKLLYHIEKQTSVIEDRSRRNLLATKPGMVNSAEQSSDSVTSNSLNDSVVELLQAGFEPQEFCPTLSKKIDTLAKFQFERNLNFQLNSNQARSALVVADWLGVLEPGEIFYQSTEPIIARGYRGNVLDGYCLLTRPPTVLPCDVQRFNAVFRSEYRHVYDLIIMSAKGEIRPACSVLSGGDYDGDKLLIISEPELVNNFDQTRANPNFADPPFRDDEFFEVDSRKICDCIRPLIETKNCSGLARESVAGYFEANNFGRLAKLHTKMSYTLGFDDSNTILVAHLYTKALDGRKQGLQLKECAWNKVKNLGGNSEPEWKLREKGNLSERLGQDFACRNKNMGKHVMDNLLAESQLALAELRRLYRSKSEHWTLKIDSELEKPWREEWERAHEAFHSISYSAEVQAYFNDLEANLSHVKTVYADYKTMRQRWAAAREMRENSLRTDATPSRTRNTPRKLGSARSRYETTPKTDILNMTHRFWRIIDEREWQSSKLSGFQGPELIRLLMASCAYVEPLFPDQHKFPCRAENEITTPGTKLATALGRRLSLRQTAGLPSASSKRKAVPFEVDREDPPSPTHSPVRSNLVAEPEAMKLDETDEEPETESEDDVIMGKPPKLRLSKESETYEFSDLELPEDWSQISADAREAAFVCRSPSGLVRPNAVMTRNLTSSTIVTKVTNPLGAQSSKTSLNTTISNSSSFDFPDPPKPIRSTYAPGMSYYEAGSSAARQFCFDVAYREIIAIKADSVWRAADQTRANSSLNGMQARKIAPNALDAMTISKKLAGIANLRAIERPFSYLPADTTPTVLRSPESPTKKSKTV